MPLTPRPLTVADLETPGSTAPFEIRLTPADERAPSGAKEG